MEDDSRIAELILENTGALTRVEGDSSDEENAVGEADTAGTSAVEDPAAAEEAMPVQEFASHDRCAWLSSIGFLDEEKNGFFAIDEKTGEYVLARLWETQFPLMTTPQIAVQKNSPHAQTAQMQLSGDVALYAIVANMIAVHEEAAQSNPPPPRPTEEEECLNKLGGQIYSDDSVEPLEEMFELLNMQ